MEIALFGRSFDTQLGSSISNLFQILEQRNLDIIVFKPFLEFLNSKKIITKKFKTFSQSSDLGNTTYCLSIGGDGTLLESVTYIRDKDIPILGINAGRLGFLSTVKIESIPEAIEKLFAKKFRVDDRILIELKSDSDLFGELNFALNEFAILKRDTSSMIVVHTYINGEFLNSYWADGLLVSTPTGSTGYSLSCGGPLVLPHTSNFIVAPVNPHNLNVRPMVVSDDSELSFKIEGRSKKFLVSVDSRSKSVDAKESLSIKKAPFSAKLVELEGYSHFNTLRNKLNWGLDIRN